MSKMRCDSEHYSDGYGMNALLNQARAMKNQPIIGGAEIFTYSATDLK